MKVFALISCLLAVAVADYSHHHHYPLHYPVIGHNGVPLEPAEVVHARNAHLAIVAATKAHRGHGDYYGAGYNGAEQYGAHYGHHGYHIPVIGHNGVPLDTPEVAAAKAAHFAAYAKASHHGHYRKRRGIYSYANQASGHYHVPIIGHNGVPLDTPEVAAAKAAHFAAHAKVGGASLGYAHGYQHYGYPALAHDGQPLETPEVVALKHAHFAAHAEAKSRVGAYGGYGAGYNGEYEGHHGGHGAFHGAYHIPVIGHNGVPHDTPEVAAAKQYHFKAHAEAASRAYGHGHLY